MCKVEPGYEKQHRNRREHGVHPGQLVGDGAKDSVIGEQIPFWYNMRRRARCGGVLLCSLPGLVTPNWRMGIAFTGEHRWGEARAYAGLS
jgi:hypothetical protein